MEEEVRRILNRAVEQEKRGLGTGIAAIFAEIGGVDLDIPPRSMGREAPDFSEVAE